MVDKYKLGRLDKSRIVDKVNITSEHPQYIQMKEKWCLVRDAEESNYQKYVIPPEYDRAKLKGRVAVRNHNYISRAVYTNFTYGTMGAWAGIATAKPASIELPTALEYLIEDATEDRLSLRQLDRKALREIGGYGRFIMFTDFPSIELGLSAEQVNNIDPKPRIKYYIAEDMINWDIQYVNGEYQLVFAVLREKIRLRTDGFSWLEEYQYRIIELDQDGDLMVTIRDFMGQLKTEPMWPKFNNKYINYLPIDIVGAEDNNTDVDEAPAWPIAHVSMGHLRNSASFEDNMDSHAQGTLFITSDLTTSQWQELTARRPVVMGSREAYFLGKNGTASLCQLDASQILDVAMKRKEDQMFALGAHMLTAANANAPVDTTHMNMGTKVAPIVNWVSNYNQALYQQVLNCARYLNVPEDGIKIDYPLDFIPVIADARVLETMLAQQMGGIISKQILRGYDRQLGIIPESITDEDIDKQVEEETKKDEALNPEPVVIPNNNQPVQDVNIDNTNSTKQLK